MRILGYDITVKAAQPKRKSSADRGHQLAEILPPYGSPGIARPWDGDLMSRAVTSDPRELWYLALPSKLTPRHVLQILRSALAGDLWQQWQLFSLMLDSWPMLRKCCHELRSAVSQTRFTVQPFVVPGKDATPNAKKRSDFCSELMVAMKPDPMDPTEKGFGGLIYDLTDAFVNGLVLIEILWADSPSSIYPRALCWVHPRHYTFTTGGKLAITDVSWRDSQIPDPNKFIVGAYNSRSGSALGAGMLRPLAWWWSAAMFNREWMLDFAQRFGQPFRWSTYKPGTPPEELAKIDDMLANMGNAGWGRFVEGTTLQFHPPGTLGPQEPHRSLMEMADTSCQLLILGQTLTSDVHDSGSRALGTVHKAVRQERIEEIAHWCGQTLTEQLMTAICRLNFGDDTEAPKCIADFTEQSNPLETAKVYDVFLNRGVPIVAEEFYRENKLKQPQEGDKVLVGGKLGVLGSTEEELGATPPEPTNTLPAPAGDDPAMDGADGKVSAREELRKFAVVLARAAESKRFESAPADLRALLKSALPALVKATREDLEPVTKALDSVLNAKDEHFDDECRKFREHLKQLVLREPKASSTLLRQTMAAAFANGVARDLKPKRAKVNAQSSNDDADRFVAIIAIRNPEQPEVLLVQRGGEPKSGEWACPGGHAERNETTLDAAKRELEEETGLAVEQLSHLGVENIEGGTLTWYVARVNADAEATAGGDAADTQWCSADDVPKLAWDNEEWVERAFNVDVNRAAEPPTLIVNVNSNRAGRRTVRFLENSNGKIVGAEMVESK